MKSDTFTGEAICAACSSQNGGCCQTDPASVHLCFPLSVAEWRRIAPYSYIASLEAVPKDTNDTSNMAVPDIGNAMQHRQALAPLDSSVPPPIKDDAICVVETNSEEFLTAMCALFQGEGQKIQQLFSIKGKHLRLRTRKNGSCIFLGSSGCRLPRVVRPWYCLLFPVWVQRNTVTLFVAEKCLVAERSKSPEQGLRQLKIRPQEVFKLYDSLRKDWGL